MVASVLARLPKTLHGTCERMPAKIKGERYIYWQHTGDPTPKGLGAAPSRQRTAQLQWHLNQNMDMVQRLLWDYPSGSRAPANSESESDGEEDEGGSVQLEYEFFVALLRDYHDVLTAGTTPMPIPTAHETDAYSVVAECLHFMTSMGFIVVDSEDLMAPPITDQESQPEHASSSRR